jgi:hypothetical protein
MSKPFPDPETVYAVEAKYNAVTSARDQWPGFDHDLPNAAFGYAYKALTPVVVFGANQSARSRELTRKQIERQVRTQVCKDFGISIFTPLLLWRLIQLVAFIVQQVLELRRRQAAEDSGV